MKNLFKYLWSILIITAMLVSSGCKKESGETAYYIRFRVDGILKEYKYTYISNFATSQNGELIGFMGMARLTEDVHSELMEIRVSFPRSKGIDTYTNVGPVGTKPFASLNWQGSPNTNSYFTANTTNNVQLVTISFTQVTSEYIRGTFHGTLVNSNIQSVSEPPTRSISEGKFFLKLSQ